jgi:tripartite-type tricarboxylate transporter receptor subunit TctC
MRKSIRSLVGAVALLAIAPIAVAQPAAFPPPLIKLIVPFPAGASTDIIARKLAPQLATRLGTTVIVENRAGGSSLIGSSAVAKGPRDGSMLLLTTPSLVTVAATMRSMPFDISTELVPVSMISEGPMMVAVSTKTSIKTPADLVAAARGKPDAVTYGTSGIGTLAHLATELLNDAANVQMRHIPYKGSAQAVIDLDTGTIDMMIAAHASFAPHVKSGRVREIAVTSAQASAAFPGVPPMASAAPGFHASIWAVVFAPGGTPPAILQRLNRELNEIAATKEMRELAAADGASPIPLTPDELGKRIAAEVAAYRKVATAKNIVAE